MERLQIREPIKICFPHHAVLRREGRKNLQKLVCTKEFDYPMTFVKKKQKNSSQNPKRKAFHITWLPFLGLISNWPHRSSSESFSSFDSAADRWNRPFRKTSNCSVNEAHKLRFLPKENRDQEPRPVKSNPKSTRHQFTPQKTDFLLVLYLFSLKKCNFI